MRQWIISVTEQDLIGSIDRTAVLLKRICCNGSTSPIFLDYFNVNLIIMTLRNGMNDPDWYKKYPLESVFGVSNKRIISYVERKEVDDKFVESLTSRKHIIVFGSSKQGKTSLIDKHLFDNQFVRVNCSPETVPVDIYKSILRQLDISFEEEVSEQFTREGEVKTSLKAKVKIPFLTDVKGSGEVSGKLGQQSETKYKNVPYNLFLPQDISEILMKKGFDKRIVIENFHYLDMAVQKEMSFHLRVFEESNILFIILGIWREKNRLVQFNGDLQDRLIEIPVEPWGYDDFKRVLFQGENPLNVLMANIVDDIIENSFGSIGVFQELCKESCVAANVFYEQIDPVYIEKEHLGIAINKKLDDYYGRHIRSLEVFIQQKTGGSGETPLFIPYYFVRLLLKLNFELIQDGIKRSEIHEGIKDIHHRSRDVRSSDISYFLHNLVHSQLKKNIRPPLFDYDRSTGKVKIIDSTLYYFLKHINVDHVMEEIGDPFSSF